MARITDVALTCVGPLAWGSTYLVTSELLPPGQPLTAALLRALPAGLLAVAIGRRLPRGVWWWRAAVLGTLNIGVFFPLLFVAAYRLPGGPAAVLGAVSPLVVAALALPLLGERPTAARLGWASGALAGVALVVVTGPVRLDAWGIAAGLTATCSMAVGTVLTRRWGRPVGVLPYAGWQLTAGGLVIAPVALLREGVPGGFDGPAAAGLTWLGLVGALLAYTLWFRGLAVLPAGQAAFLPLLSPVVAVLLGWAALGQGLSPVQWLGFGLALLSIVAAQRSTTPTSTSAPATTPKGLPA